MPRQINPVLGMAVLLALSMCGCSRAPIDRAERIETPQTLVQSSGLGAFDVVKMGRYGGRKGPIYFAHALHADLPGLDGKILTCAYCHFEVCGSPRRCGECHRGKRAGSRLPST